MVEEQVGEVHGAGAMMVDPFGLAPDWVSSIKGLGGQGACPDAAYAFHTPYDHYDEGEVVLTLTFDNLVANRGVLVLRINAYPDQAGSVAYQVILDEVLLRGVMADKGRAWIRFLPRPGTRYALLGHIYGETDASADGLRVTAQHAASIDADAERTIADRRTVFAGQGVRPVAKLLASHRATLRDPVSQLCTESQFEEPFYAEWVARMGGSVAWDRKQWEQVFTLQALRRYGMLETGARGLGFGAGGQPVAAVIAQAGCKVVVVDTAASSGDEAATAAFVEGLRRPAVCADAVFDQRVAARTMPVGELPVDLAGFDFLWSSGHAGIMPVAAGIGFVIGSIQCLKPGGVAVFTGDLALAAGQSATGGETMRRQNIEQLTLMLIGAGHEVAQLNFEGGWDGDAAAAAGAAVTSFGLIVRRGLRER